MRENRAPSRKWLKAAAEHFEATVDLVSQVFGASAFRVSNAAGRPTERNVNRALFDAHMVVSSIADPAEAVSKRRSIVKRMAGLYDSTDFVDTISRATGDKARTLARIGAVGDVFSESGVGLDWSALGDIDWRHTARSGAISLRRAGIWVSGWRRRGT